eukprot:2594602-Karenia_brevis.AAC.1
MQSCERWRHSMPGRLLQWEDIFCSCFGLDWKQLAKEPNWPDRIGVFIHHAYAKFRRKSPEAAYGAHKAARAAASTEPILKSKRKVVEPRMDWFPCEGSLKRVVFLGDSLITVNWLNGIWRPKFAEYQKLVAEGQAGIDALMRQHLILPRSDKDDFVKHVHREFNERADTLSKLNADCDEHNSPESYDCWQVYFDGAFDQQSASMRIGVCIQGAQLLQSGALTPWTDVAQASRGCRERGYSSTHSEVLALNFAITLLRDVLAGTLKCKIGQ